MSSPEPATNPRPSGAQTLQRGLRTLRTITGARDGLTIAEVAETQGIHRTIASRILATLAAEDLIRRGPDGRYRGAAGLLRLTPAAHAALRHAAFDPIARAADTIGATVSLLVQEGDDAVALAVVEPRGNVSRITFAAGHRHRLDRGSAGAGILMQYPASPTDSEVVRRARVDGAARTFGEVEPGMFGLAVPIPDVGTPACLNVITHREELLDPAVATLRAAAAEISRALAA